MAGARTIRELLVSLGVKADNASLARFDKGVGQVKSGMGQLVGVATLVTGALVAVTTAVITATVQTAQMGDEAAKAATRIGVTAEEMQELAFAARISGAEMTDVEVGFRRMAANAIDADNGVGEAVDAFDRLGVSARNLDGDLKSPIALFTELAGEIAKVPDDLERAALAQDIFGRGGSKLLPLLEQGAEGIDKLRARARALGLVMDDEAAAASEKFIDTIEEAKSVLTGLRNTIGIALMPVLTDLIERFRDWFLANRAVIQQRLERFADRMGRAFTKAADILERVDEIVRTKLGGWQNIFKALGSAITGALGIKAFIGVITVLIGLTNIVGALATLLGVSFLGALGVIALALIPLIANLAFVIVLWGSFALVVEDVITFLRGGRSALGALIDRFVDSRFVAASINRVFKSMGRLLRALSGAAGTVANEFKKALAPAIIALEIALAPVLDLFDKLGEIIFTALIAQMQDVADLIDAISLGFEKFSRTGQFDFAGVGSAFGNVVDPFATGGAGAAQAAASTRSTTVGGTSIVIQGVGISAEQAASLAEGALMEAARKARAAVAGGER